MSPSVNGNIIHGALTDKNEAFFDLLRWYAAVDAAEGLVIVFFFKL